MPPSLLRYAGYIFFGSMVEIGRRLRSTASLLTSTLPIRDIIRAAGLDPDVETNLLEPSAAAVAAARRFLLLDLRNVTGIDATTASAFAMLRRSLDSRGVTMVLTGVSRQLSVKRMLIANGVIAWDGQWEGGRGCPAFDSMDAALAWCEEHFKQVP
jgi:anti-anti-sigma regulatory factor